MVILFQSVTSSPKMYVCIVAQEESQSALQAAENLGVGLGQKLLREGAGTILTKVPLHIHCILL